MVLEASFIILDTSECMINGDFIPDRLSAQEDAVHAIYSSKRRSHPENSIGLMTMSGSTGIVKKSTAQLNQNSHSISSPMVLTSLTEDHGKIIKALHNIKHLPLSSISNVSSRGIDNNANAKLNLASPGIIDAYLPLSNVIESLHIAQLALKHRANKQQAQRIILFISASVFIENSSDKLSAALEQGINLGKSLKKNNIALDICHFTHQEDPQHPTKLFLDELVASANNHDNSHIVHFYPCQGSGVLSDRLLRSDILGYGDGTAGSMNDQSGFDYGVDPDLDPELALALKMSMEEEQARQMSANSTEANRGNGVSHHQNEGHSDMQDTMEMDPELAAAIALSMSDSVQASDRMISEKEEESRKSPNDSTKRKFDQN